MFDCFSDGADMGGASAESGGGGAVLQGRPGRGQRPIPGGRHAPHPGVEGRQQQDHSGTQSAPVQIQVVILITLVNSG